MEKFFLPEDAVKQFRQAIPKGEKAQSEWQEIFDSYKAKFPAEAAEVQQFFSGKLPDNWAADMPKWKPEDKPLATRAAGGQVLNALAKNIPNIMGGSADLNPSTNTALKDAGDFQPYRIRRPFHARRSRRRLGLCRTQRRLRRSRTCHGRSRQRHGCPWRHSSL